MSVAIRVLRTDDGPLLCKLFYRLSPESVYRRFFTLYTAPPPEAIRRLVDVDHDRRDALVAVVDGEIVGVARYAALVNDPDTAEVAVVVEDAWQGRGLGRRLLEGVTALARLHGLTALCATVLADNRPAIAMLHALYPDAVWTPNGTEYELTIPLPARERVPA
ncbi:MAG TPA: GNAT family N-acetyltransferase [Mycobacteriales bacterium]|jgi:GNAT superfamily N-acetyltransferase|nr:GNAT family N-acetyltransferase [Mycobacteriales bacterium]